MASAPPSTRPRSTTTPAAFSDQLWSYALPLAQRLPAVEVEQASPSPNNPEGIKGAGEGGAIGALATVAAAVEDALAPLGLTLNSLPISEEELAQKLSAIRS